MRDTNAQRFDVAAVVRAAKRFSGQTFRWTVSTINNGFGLGPGIRLFDVAVEHDDVAERLVLDESIIVELERVRVRVPSTGRRVAGPVLARCPRGCGQRVRILWLGFYSPADVFPVCRACARVEYATPGASEFERAEIAYDRIRRGFGLSKYETHEPRPYQRMRTYEREARRLAAARTRLEEARARSPYPVDRSPLREPTGPATRVSFSL